MAKPQEPHGKPIVHLIDHGSLYLNMTWQECTFGSWKIALFPLVIACRAEARYPYGFLLLPAVVKFVPVHYEISFIQRLARLGRTDFMCKFQNAYRYIDDLCWINSHNPKSFLSTEQIRTDDNPYWVYPLDVLEIKCEVAKYTSKDPARGISANFMNMEVLIADDRSQAYSTQKYDKRRTLLFAYTQYIKFKSNRPIWQSTASSFHKRSQFYMYLAPWMRQQRRFRHCSKPWRVTDFMKIAWSAQFDNS